MSGTLLVLAVLAGWCGTPYPKRWRFPWPFPPIPDPGPICPMCGNILGALGGVIFQIVLASVLPNEVTITSALVTGFIGGRLINDLELSCQATQNVD